ncbi:MAG: M23 family metallopeptidase [bacterium]|nr:M23 family metallopeptidase [bacterium]
MESKKIRPISKFTAIISLFILLISIQSAFAEEKVIIDNLEVQHYRGKTGKWIMPESRKKLKSIIRKFRVTMSEVKQINGSKFKYRDYIFIPYSKEYYEKLKVNGLERKSVNSTKNEYIWPIRRVRRITSTFGMRWGQLHTGVDLPATKGTPVIAALDGRIISVGYSGGHGKSIYVEHRNHFYSRYSHNSVILVKKGDFIKKGQIIALVGSTGNSTGNHLHFEIRYNDIPLNPLDFLPRKEHLKKAHKMKSAMKRRKRRR